MGNKQVFEKCLKARHPYEINKAIQNLILYTDSERKSKIDNINSFSKEIFEKAISHIFTVVND